MAWGEGGGLREVEDEEDSQDNVVTVSVETQVIDHALDACISILLAGCFIDKRGYSTPDIGSEMF